MSEPPPISPALISAAAFAGEDGALALALDAFAENGGEEPVVARVGTDRPPVAEWLAALEEERFGLLHVAGDGAWPTTEVLGAVARWCRERGVLLVADVPGDVSTADAIAFASRLADDAGEASGHVAVYFPALRGSSTGGAVAGVVARTPVWKNPAGGDATIAAGHALVAELDQRTLRQLAEANVNGLRVLPDRATVIWGGRTLSRDPEWKYVATRRLAAYIEHSIDGSLQWAVFEPNDEPLWAAIRQTVSNFLVVLWRDGALQGTRPDDAFFVRCGLGSTMTAGDIADGRLRVLVGFAPVRPAEFVNLEVQRTGLSPP